MHHLPDINAHYTVSFFIALLRQVCDIVFPEAIHFLNKDIVNIVTVFLYHMMPHTTVDIPSGHGQ